MERNHDFRKEVLRALKKRIITREEAKECLIRGFGKQEIPIFYFVDMESTPLGMYVLGLEKMGIIKPLIRLNEGI
jgi:hypothetical protein